MKGLRCAALTKKGTRCKKTCERGHGLCSVHRPIFNFQVRYYEQRFSPNRRTTMPLQRPTTDWMKP